MNQSLESPKLISCKIWVIEKPWHTVKWLVVNQASKSCGLTQIEVLSSFVCNCNLKMSIFEVQYLAFWLFEVQFFMNLFIKLSMWHFFNPFHDIRMTPAHSTKPKSLDNNSFLFKLKLIRHTFVTELSKNERILRIHYAPETFKMWS